MPDTSGMLPNWLSEAIGDRRDPTEIGGAVLQAPEWIQLIQEAIREAEVTMQSKQSNIGLSGGFPSYNQEVARAIVTRLARLYPDVYLPKP